MNPDYTTKIKSREELLAICQSLRQSGQRIGFTSGVFDILHPGHVDYLARARAKCDVLIVALNSDASVKENKGDLRPVCGEQSRAEIVAGLESVSFVFLFDEKNNNQNVKILKPDFYFKAGDYSKSGLSSGPLVEQYGGKVELIPMKPGYSSSAVIKKISEGALNSVNAALELPSPASRPAVFVDRDGTINEQVEYLHEPEKFKLLPGVLEGLKKLQEGGYRIVIVTNQQGIGLGYFSKEDFFRVSRELLKAAGKAGVRVDKIYYCPHSLSEECPCKKPFTGMIERAVRELNIDLPASFVVGDMSIDVKLARNAGCGSVLVKSGYGGEDALHDEKPDYVAKDFADAGAWIVKHGKAAVRRVPAESAPKSTLEAIGRISARIGHDFNNLLGAMQGCLDLVRKKAEEARPNGLSIDRQLAIMQNSVARATEFTRRLRGYVRPGPLETSPAHLKELIEETAALINAAGVELVLEVKSDSVVEINSFSVQQVLTSLCLNALEALEGQSDRFLVLGLSEISIEQKNSTANLPAGRYAHLVLIDHGQGLKKELIARLFQPFFTTKEQKLGKGLGLSLVMAREIMKKHGGAIVVDSQEGCGTAVHLYFPVRES
jgi:D-glycero-D-manno-heptose 1,7-bisphosphate phosphatase